MSRVASSKDRASRELSQEGVRLENQRWFKVVAHAGLGARGIIYLLLAYLAFDVAAHGASPTQTSGEGALQEVARQPAAPLLLTVLACGLAAYAAWRLVQAIAGRSNPSEKPSLAKRLGWLAIAVAYFSLCVQAVELIIRGSSASAGSNPRPWAATVLMWPGGQELLFVAALGLAIGGAVLAIWGIAHNYDKDLALERLGRSRRWMVRALGALGDLARGFLIILVGVYLINAALLREPQKAQSVDSALKALAHRSYGPVLIGIVAGGLACYAAYSLCEARLGRL